MITLRFLLKEASLLVAFVVLGALLLLSFWIGHNLRKSIVREFQNAQISIVLKDGAEQKVRQFIEGDSRVIRYDFFSSQRNKERLGKFYPELRNVIAPLDERFFPASAVVSVNDTESFLAALKGIAPEIQTQLLHEPPHRLSQFLDILSVVFLALWLMTLTLVLYFNLERITVEQEPRWSLMKMLGAKPGRLFTPLWVGQVSRVAIASASAIVLAAIVTSQVRASFVWNWVSVPMSIWFGFFLLSVALTSVISFVLFYTRYQRVSIG